MKLTSNIWMVQKRLPGKINVGWMSLFKPTDELYTFSTNNFIVVAFKTSKNHWYYRTFLPDLKPIMYLKARFSYIDDIVLDQDEAIKSFNYSIDNGICYRFNIIDQIYELSTSETKLQKLK